MYSFFSYVKRYKRYFILGSLFKMIESAVEVMIPFIMVMVLERSDRSYTLSMGGVMLAIIVSGVVLATLGQYFSAKAAASVSRSMREDLYQKINSLEFYDLDRFGAASLINRLTADVNAIQNAVLIFVRIAIRAPFLIVGSIFFALRIDSGIALIIVCCLPFLAASFYFITKRLAPRYTAIQKTLDAIALETKEDLEGIRVVRAFNRQDREVDEFRAYTGKYADLSVGAGKLSAALGPLNSFIINCGVVAIVWFVGLAVQKDSFPVTHISAFIAYMIQIVNALNMITHLTLNFVRATASNKRVKEVFFAESSLKDGENTEKRTVGETVLEFRNVDFGYDENGTALEGISFSLKRGETLGIIGGTASGKTTLINLIPRFYDIRSGRILFRGIDVADYPIAELRREIAVVPQEATVLSGTVRENIGFGIDAPYDTVVTAAKLAQAHEFIEKMPKG
ncbi:MAG: ABC transporter ATP-binding protein/permease, partial [Clostridiales bacterium]|nr:ABC transporter ATP-binding protein/permease [Clostridiales bacterium]